MNQQKKIGMVQYLRNVLNQQTEEIYDTYIDQYQKKGIEINIKKNNPISQNKNKPSLEKHSSNSQLSNQELHSFIAENSQNDSKLNVDISLNKMEQKNKKENSFSEENEHMESIIFKNKSFDLENKNYYYEDDDENYNCISLDKNSETSEEEEEEEDYEEDSDVNYMDKNEIKKKQELLKNKLKKQNEFIVELLTDENNKDNSNDIKKERHVHISNLNSNILDNFDNNNNNKKPDKPIIKKKLKKNLNKINKKVTIPKLLDDPSLSKFILQKTFNNFAFITNKNKINSRNTSIYQNNAISISNNSNNSKSVCNNQRNTYDKIKNTKLNNIPNISHINNNKNKLNIYFNYNEYLKPKKTSINNIPKKQNIKNISFKNFNIAFNNNKKLNINKSFKKLLNNPIHLNMSKKLIIQINENKGSTNVTSGNVDDIKEKKLPIINKTNSKNFQLKKNNSLTERKRNNAKNNTSDNVTNKKIKIKHFNVLHGKNNNNIGLNERNVGNEAKLMIYKKYLKEK